MVVVYDDLDKAEDRKVAADKHAIPLSFDGETVELDLTTGHYQELHQLLRPYMEAGAAPTSRRQPAGSRGRARLYSHSPGIKAYNAAMRQFADARLREHPEYNYATESGGLYYPQALREAYEAHRASTSGR
jgi:hypothetical protein